MGNGAHYAVTSRVVCNFPLSNGGPFRRFKRIEVSRRVKTERENTDASLRVEREKTDQALVDRQAAVDENADETVEQARSVGRRRRRHGSRYGR